MQPAEKTTGWPRISTSAAVRRPPFRATAAAKLGALFLALVLIGPAWADYAFSLSHWALAGAQAIEVIRQENKTRGSVAVTELEFTAQVDRTVYRNHGYFYSGPEGTVQLRGWAYVADYPAMAEGIGELLDGLTVLTVTGK